MTLTESFPFGAAGLGVFAPEGGAEVIGVDTAGGEEEWMDEVVLANAEGCCAALRLANKEESFCKVKSGSAFVRPIDAAAACGLVVDGPGVARSSPVVKLLACDPELLPFELRAEPEEEPAKKGKPKDLLLPEGVGGGGVDVPLAAGGCAMREFLREPAIGLEEFSESNGFLS